MADLVQQARAFSMDKRFLPLAYDLVPAMADEIERLRAALRKAEGLIDGAEFMLGAEATSVKKRWADWRRDARALLDEIAETNDGKADQP